MKHRMFMCALVLLAVVCFSRPVFSNETSCSNMPPLDELRDWHHSKKGRSITLTDDSRITATGVLYATAYEFRPPESYTGEVECVVAAIGKTNKGVLLLTFGLKERKKKVPTLCRQQKIVTWASRLL